MIVKNSVLSVIKKHGYLVISFVVFFMFDYVLRNAFINYSAVSIYNGFTLCCVLIWCFVLTLIASLLPKVFLKRIYLILVGIISLVILYGQTIYFNLFYKFFSFADLSLADEGMQYADFSYFTLPKSIIASGLILMLALIGACFLMQKEEKRKIRYGISVALGLGFAGCLGGYYLNYPEPVDASLWNASTSPSYVYESYNDTTKALLMSGTYQYTFRNLVMTYLPINQLTNKDLVNQVDEFVSSTDPQYSNNDMTGIFEGKNLILIQLENIDQWMITEQNMPTLYRLREEGINFVNHYSASFSTGRTFNTEYIANTGFVPPLNGTAPSYIFSQNSYPLSLANQFKNAGYTVNSYHSNGGQIYNRQAVHEAFGYEKYHNYVDMNMDDYTMDSQMINGYDVIMHDELFMDFIITYSGHGPFSTENAACSAHYDEVSGTEAIQDETYLCGMAQAKETELFIEELIAKMTEDGSIDNTVLIFYTDHYAYGTIDSELEEKLKGTTDSNLLFNTPFFIWSSDIEPMEVTKYTSTVDLLPTILNLFGIQTDTRYFAGRDVFQFEDNGYVCFSDGSYYDGETYYIGGTDMEISNQVQERIKNFWDKLDLNWAILNTDYFSNHEV